MTKFWKVRIFDKIANEKKKLVIQSPDTYSKQRLIEIFQVAHPKFDIISVKPAKRPRGNTTWE